MSSTNVHVVSSPEQFKAILSEDLNRVSLINFWAPWAEPCTRMNSLVAELARTYPHLVVLQVEAEEQEDISESFDIQAVPSIVLLRGHVLLARVHGADAEKVTTLVETHLGKGAPPPAQDAAQTAGAAEDPHALEARMRGIMRQSPVVLFMKGAPDAPRCGFSRRAVQLLRDAKVAFTHFDILEDEAVRQGLKTLNDWPTFPQFIVNGDFVGGLDVVTEMASSGEFAEVFATG